MSETPKDNVRKMFSQFDDIRVQHPSEEVVGVGGFVRGQSVDVYHGETLDSGWKISGFEIFGDEVSVSLQKGDGDDAYRETIPLKTLRKMNPEQ